MSAKTQHKSILLAIAGFIGVVVIVGLIGFFTMGKTENTIQGEVEVSEYRVSSKLPARIVELRVQEGDYVHAGDTLVILEMPELDAQKRVAEAAEGATEAMSSLAQSGLRKEQIQSAYQLLQQAMTAAEIAKKSYTRMQNLFDEGVMSAQKRDEAYAAYKATEAQVEVARNQYEIAKRGAREQEKLAARKNAQAAKSAVDVVASVLKETVQVAAVDGEISAVYPKVGELVGMGSPIMNIAMMRDIWATFNIREDRLKGLKIGDTFTAFSPAFNKNVELKVYQIRDEGAFAVWKATKSNGQYDLKTFEVKARFVKTIDGLRPGMSLIIRE